VLEWLAKPENGHVLKAMGDGGTDIWAHSKPGGGKTSFANAIGGIRMPEINNETLLWMLTLDELECLPLAPYMTVAVPKGIEYEVHAKPRNPTLPTTEIELTDVFRDTIEYRTPRDLMTKIVPGGLYAVLPDPLFRGCEKQTTTYTPAREAEEPAEVTPLRDVNFAFMDTRAKDDEFLHPTAMVHDEFSGPRAAEPGGRRERREPESEGVPGLAGEGTEEEPLDDDAVPQRRSRRRGCSREDAVVRHDAEDAAAARRCRGSETSRSTNTTSTGSPTGRAGR